MKVVKLSEGHYINSECINDFAISKNYEDKCKVMVAISKREENLHLIPFEGTEEECLDYIKDLALQINED